MGKKVLTSLVVIGLLLVNLPLDTGRVSRFLSLVNMQLAYAADQQYYISVSATQANTTTNFGFTADNVIIINDGANEIYVDFTDGIATTSDLKVNSGEALSVSFHTSTIGIICDTAKTATVRIFVTNREQPIQYQFPTSVGSGIVIGSVTQSGVWKVNLYEDTTTDTSILYTSAQTDTVVIPDPGTTSIYITNLTISADTQQTSILLEKAGTTPLFGGYIAAYGGVSPNLLTPLQVGSNNLTITSVGGGNLRISLSYYIK